MSVQPDAREALEQALRVAWSNEKGVSVFRLAFDPTRLAFRNGGWVVPVASGVQTGSAYELGRVIDRLQEAVETATNLPVTIYLDPFTGSAQSLSRPA